MPTDYTAGGTPESVPVEGDGALAKCYPRSRIGGDSGNVAVGKCPGCGAATVWLHCASHMCRWLWCEGCSVTWSEKSGGWFR